MRTWHYTSIIIIQMLCIYPSTYSHIVQPWHEVVLGITSSSTTDKLITPHLTIHQLAPRQGKGIRIVLIDTGTTLNSFFSKKLSYAPHMGCLNITGIAQEIIHICAHEVQKIVGSSQKNWQDLMIYIPQWMHELYTSEYPTSSISLQAYLREKNRMRYYCSIVDLLEEHRKNFTLVDIPINNEQQLVIQEFLPAAHVPYHIAAWEHTMHGSHSIALIQSISPQAEIIMIQAFDATGTSSLAMFYEALICARHLKPDILATFIKIDSLDIHNDPMARAIQHILTDFPYTIAPAGNDKTPNCHTLAYPARFPSTTFSIGAFGIYRNEYFVPSFSQYEPGIGPTFLLPGVDILAYCPSPYSSGMIPCIMTGTSTAAALFTGFLASVIAEFGTILSRDEIIRALKLSTYNNPNITMQRCQQASLYGALDMRLALHLLHTLQYYKKRTGNTLAPEIIQHAHNLIIQHHPCVPYMNHSSHFSPIAMKKFHKKREKCGAPARALGVVPRQVKRRLHRSARTKSRQRRLIYNNRPKLESI